MFKVSTIGLHACFQALCEVLDDLVDRLLWHVVPYLLQSGFQLGDRLWLRLQFVVLSSMAPTRDSQGGSDLGDLVATDLSQ